MFRSYALSSSSSSSEDEVDVPRRPVATTNPFSLPSSSSDDDDGIDGHRVTAKRARGTTTIASKPPFSILFDPSSCSDDDDDMDDGRGGHRAKLMRGPPPPPPPPSPPAQLEPSARAPPQQQAAASAAAAAAAPAASAAGGGGKKLPKWMPAPKVEEQDEDDDDEEDEEDLLGHQLSASRARWLTGANSAKRAKPAAAAVPVKKKKAKGGAGSRKAKDEPKVFPAAARAVKQEQEECSEEEEGSDGMEYDDFGEVKGFKPGVKGPPKDKRALAVWRNAVARTLLEGEKEKRILESACKTLEAHLTGLAKQTDEELRVAAAAIEEGKRAALALRALGLLEGAALAGTGAVAGRGGGKLNVWDETELPMQESEAESEAEVEMPSEAAIAELRAKVERAQQVEEEARARRLFRPEEQAPLALGWGEGGADVLAPDPRRELSPLERVLSIELLCEEIWGSLSLEAMCALRAASRASYHYHDELAFIQAVGRKCKAWQEEAAKGKKKGGGKQSVSEFGAAVAKMNARERARQAQERQDASDSGSSSSAARRHSKKKRKRPMLSAPSSGSDDSEDEDEDDEVDMSCLVDGGDEGEEEEGKQDLATVMERARTVSYQRQHGLGKGTLEVLRQEGRYVLNSHLATQARENEGSSVRRRVEAFLARCGIRLFPSKYDEGDSNSDSDSDDENEAPSLIKVVAWGRGKETKASVRVTLAKGLDKKRVAGMAAKRLKYGVDTMAQLDVQKSKLRAMTNEVKALKQHIRYLGYDTETAVAGLGTVKVGQPGVGAQLYKNKLRQDVFAKLPEETRVAILNTGLIKYQGGKLVTKVGKSGRAGSDAASNTLMQADRQGSGHVPTYKKMPIVNAQAKAKAAREQQDGDGV